MTELLPDLALARRYLATQELPGRVLLCAVTGAHLYGFPSADSDLDLKGIHLAPTEAVVGLDPVVETIDHTELFEGVECDLTTHEARKALDLLLRGNGNLIERLASPFQVVEGPETEALRALLPHALSQQCHGHYNGYFRAMQAEHLRNHRVKSLLYSFRVALTGIHLLRTGEVEANLTVLATRYEMPALHALIRRKLEGAEKEPLAEAEAAPWIARWPELQAQLDEARRHSVLPEQPTGRAALSDWLVDARMGRR